MSTPPALPPSRLTIPAIVARKGKTPLVTLTAYTTPMARLLDSLVDILLVGDSLGMVIYGLDTTLGVTLEMMRRHTEAVMRGATRACVVVDLPFGSYQQSPEKAFKNAAWLLAKTGCQAVKLEGGAEMAETIAFLARRGVPVMGHVGLMPQHVNTVGGFRTQGRNDDSAERVLRDAAAVAEAGAFAMVIEAVAEPLARRITAEVPIPTIGIGASPACDGQVLVIDDILGSYGDFRPHFVRRYAELGAAARDAAAAFAEDVRARRFPAAEHCFTANGASRAP